MTGGGRVPGDEIERAVTITIPGGVVLTSEEWQLREKHTMNLDRALIVARSILKKVETACAT